MLLNHYARAKINPIPHFLTLLPLCAITPCPATKNHTFFNPRDQNNQGFHPRDQNNLDNPGPVHQLRKPSFCSFARKWSFLLFCAIPPESHPFLSFLHLLRFRPARLGFLAAFAHLFQESDPLSRSFS